MVAALMAATLMVSTGCSLPFASLGAANPIPEAALGALQDASEYADELSARYEGFAEATEQSESDEEAKESTSEETRTYEVASAEVEDGIARLQADIDAIESDGASWEGREQALAAMKNLQGVLTYEQDVLEAQHTASQSAEGEEGMEGAFTTLTTLTEEYEGITPPDCIQDYLKNTIDTFPTVNAALAYSVAAPDSTLSQYTTRELLVWWLTKQSAYDAQSNEILVQQCKASGNMLRAVAEGAQAETMPEVSVDMIDEIAPNLYPSLDAVANLGITSYDDAHSIQVEVEVVGFSQKFEQRYDLAQGYNYLTVKPALLPKKDLPDLSANTTTQLNVKVSDSQTGEVLAQESHPIELLSIYDFRWTNDEFGDTASFDILAWLRPQAEEVNALNRAAADVLGGWTGGVWQSIDGYQHGADVIATLYQAMAIQQAISDAGVSYIMDAYSFTSDQHVLTPDKVVQKRQGLCIETTLLMASCLMSAGMHPLIIITPSHAQVAVETYANSGNYFLLETTLLPFSGPNTSATSDADPLFYNGFLAADVSDDGSVCFWTTSGSSDEWKTYFEAVGNSSMDFEGIFVIDCQLQQVMDIQGLENV